MKPKILITTYFVDKSEMGDNERHNRIRGITGQDMAMSSMDYARAVNKAGGTPLLTAPITDKEYIKNLVSNADGILFAGGADINPLYYGETPGVHCTRIVPERDEFEFALLKEAIIQDKPILGICRGMHLINIFYSGNMYQDLREVEEEKENHVLLNLPKWHYAHEVELTEGSLVYQAFEKKRIKTNSYHHQIVKKAGKGLVVTARADDGTVEALEHPDKSFLLGVQWHPEMMFEKVEEQLKVFRFFIQQVITFKKDVLKFG